MADSELQELKVSIQQIDNKLDAYHEDVTILRTIVLGRNGDVGLIGNFERTRNDLNMRIDEACKENAKFRSKCILVLGILIGSGVLGGGVAAAFSYL